MATRSTIAIKHSDGKIYQIYCHWDGYLTGVGTVLTTYYATEELAMDMISGGDMSSLGELHDTCKYYSSRGDSNVEPREFDSLDDFVTNGQTEGYDYLFLDGKWHVKTDLTNYEFEELTDSLIELEDA
jgi:hypothetical protein